MRKRLLCGINFALVCAICIDCEQITEKCDKCYEVIGGENSPNCCNKKPIVNPCQDYKCTNLESCVLHYNPVVDPPNCTDDYFPLIPKCQEKCKMFKCRSDCVPALDNNRCPNCFCNKNFSNPCVKKNACGANQECVLQSVLCITEPCYPIKICREKCSKLDKCPDNCLTYVDATGCKKCHCCNACVNQKCPEGKKCKLNQPQCKVCPCSPIAECK